MGNKGISSKDTPLPQCPSCSNGIKLIFFYLYEESTYVSNNEYLLKRQA